MTALGLVALAGHLGRDLEANFDRVAAVLDDSRELGADLVVFPDAALGGYLPGLVSPDAPDGRDPDDLPPALDPDGKESRRLVEMAGELTVCIGYCEDDGDRRYNAAVCVHGDGVLGRHRKVHQPAAERFARARSVLHHLAERRPDAYSALRTSRRPSG